MRWAGERNRGAGAEADWAEDMTRRVERRNRGAGAAGKGKERRVSFRDFDLDPLQDDDGADGRTEASRSSVRVRHARDGRAAIVPRREANVVVMLDVFAHLWPVFRDSPLLLHEFLSAPEFQEAADETFDRLQEEAGDDDYDLRLDLFPFEYHAYAHGSFLSSTRRLSDIDPIVGRAEQFVEVMERLREAVAARFGAKVALARARRKRSKKPRARPPRQRLAGCVPRSCTYVHEPF